MKGKEVRIWKKERDKQLYNYKNERKGKTNVRKRVSVKEERITNNEIIAKIKKKKQIKRE